MQVSGTDSKRVFNEFRVFNCSSVNNILREIEGMENWGLYIARVVSKTYDSNIRFVSLMTLATMT